jgi:uncharacterized linocin/CFP29 family protein
MAENYLHREDAPFADEVWEKIDEAAVGAAKTQLTGRRVLYTEGPYGPALKSLPLQDHVVEEASDQEGVSVRGACVLPVARIEAEFTVPIRDIAAFEEDGKPLDVGPVAGAAISCARQEDALIFNGSDALKTTGLMNADGTQSVKLGTWEEAGEAAENLISAVTTLDEAGYHGPYSLVLSPARYNKLFRRYRQGNATEMQHVEQLITDGIVKAPSIEKGGVLLASGKSYASIVLGQDLSVGFIGPAGGDYEFVLTESLALWLKSPSAVCLLED